MSTYSTRFCLAGYADGCAGLLPLVLAPGTIRERSYMQGWVAGWREQTSVYLETGVDLTGIRRRVDGLEQS